MLDGLRIRRGGLAPRDKPEANGVPKQEVGGIFTLSDLEAGESARIACLAHERAGRRERLLAYGMVEGQTITLLQKSPAYVVRVDETELALDEQVARCVQLVAGSRARPGR